MGDFLAEQALAGWLVEQALGPLAYVRCQGSYPSLASLLEQDHYSTVAANSIHLHHLGQISAALAQQDIPAVLLKGAAMAETQPQGWERRTMGDIDLWLQEKDIPPACAAMQHLGFTTGEKETRPLALQMMSGGEIQYLKDDFVISLVELHLSPYPGWWLKRVAVVDKQALWARITPFADSELLFQLSPEDSLIHTAVHMTVNHQCGLKPFRSLVDMSQIIATSVLNWQVVVSRAQEMRVATAVWFALSLLHALIGPSSLQKVLPQLQPPLWQRQALQQLISPQSLLLGADLSAGRKRFLYLLLLVDRKRDISRLVARTVWPETEWLQARYGEPVNHWHHLTHLIQHGQI